MQPDDRVRLPHRAGRRSAPRSGCPARSPRARRRSPRPAPAPGPAACPRIDSPRVISQARSAPVTVASTTSLMVPPCASRTLRYAARSVRTVTNRRCWDSGPLIGESALGGGWRARRPPRPTPAGAGRGAAQHRAGAGAHGVDARCRARSPSPCTALGHQRERRRLPGRAPARRGRGPWAPALVEQHLAEVDGLDAVDEHLVRLRQHARPGRRRAPRRSRPPTAGGAGRAAGRRSGPRARGAGRWCPAAAARTGVRGSRGRSSWSSTQTGLASRPGTNCIRCR